MLPVVSLYHGVIPAVCWYFFCFAGLHSRLAGVSLLRRAALAACRYFFCSAGRHSRLAGVSLLRRAVLAACGRFSASQGGTRDLLAFLCSAGRYSRAFARHSSPYSPLIHASMMRGLYGEECPAHCLRGHFTILSFFGATVIIVVSVGSESPWTGRPARWYVFTFSISSPVIRSPGASRGIPGG